ncbi:hypothetical protein TNCV_4331191 [Trichonephila clavipes]|nr:hypothetical protein TNCV_4331191 [Trichonephila clavipes]
MTVLKSINNLYFRCIEQEPLECRNGRGNDNWTTMATHHQGQSIYNLMPADIKVRKDLNIDPQAIYKLGKTRCRSVTITPPFRQVLNPASAITQNTNICS